MSEVDQGVTGEFLSDGVSTETTPARDPLRKAPREYVSLAFLGASLPLILIALVAVMFYPATIPADSWHRFGIPALVLAAGAVLGIAAGFLLRYKPTRR